MNNSNLKRVTSILLASCLILVFGCLFGPDKKEEPKVVDPFKPLTDKENVIYNLELSYNKADIAHYEELLHADYTWYLQTADVLPGQEAFWTRAQDLNATANMFKSTRGGNPNPQLNIDRLTLDLVGQTWAAFTDTVGGAPCEDCWQTTRTYALVVVTSSGDTYIAHDLCQFIVVPVQEGSTRLYKLWRAHDVQQ